MAMTKAEKAAMDKMREELAIARALRWVEPVSPDVPPPTHSDPFSACTRGWHSFSNITVHGRTERAWSDSFAHGTGRTSRKGIGAVRGSVALCSTRLVALRVQRATLTRQCAEALADLDMEIEREIAKPTPLEDADA